MPENIKKETIDNETAENKAEEIEIEGADEESTQAAEEAKDTDVNGTESEDDALADADAKADDKSDEKPDDKKDDPFITGMDKVYKQMLTELDAAGVKPIECVGQEFDPDFHNAVMQVENDELESGTVAQELQKGYMYKDSVVRHSMVSVVQ